MMRTTPTNQPTTPWVVRDIVTLIITIIVVIFLLCGDFSARTTPSLLQGLDGGGVVLEEEKRRKCVVVVWVCFSL